MSLTTIKTALVTKFGEITGVQKSAERLDQSPENPDCPAVVLDRRKPFLSVSVPYAGTARYTWHFTVLFLLKPVGLATPEQWDAAIEPYPARFVAKVLGALKLGDTSGTVLPAPGLGDFTFGSILYGSNSYWGFTWDIDVREDVATTIAA